MIYTRPTPLLTRRRALAAAVLAAGAAGGLAGGRDPGALEAARSAVPAPVTVAAAHVVRPARVPVLGGDARLAASKLTEAERLVRAAVDAGAFPGAALAAGRGAHLALMSGIGNAEWGRYEVNAERTVYDIASLTKVVGTTSAVMLLVEDGRMALDAPVARYLPAFGEGGARGKVTVRHLLTHTSGLPAGAAAYGTADEALRRLVRTPLKAAPGERMVYSDVGMVVLWAAAERAAGEPLDQMLRRRVFLPLGMRATGFVPGEGCARCSPTFMRRGEPVRGVVHDPIARKLGGVAGNAGLFSTAADLARFAAMLASGGELEGVRIFREETLRTFTRRQPGAGNRALGWETPKERGGSSGREMSRSAFGHTGFTGTSLWVDPERGTWTVLLANRTYDPHAPNRMQALRRAVNDRVAQAAVLAE